MLMLPYCNLYYSLLCVAGVIWFTWQVLIYFIRLAHRLFAVRLYSGLVYISVYNYFIFFIIYLYNFIVYLLFFIIYYNVDNYMQNVDKLFKNVDNFGNLKNEPKQYITLYYLFFITIASSFQYYILNFEHKKTWYNIQVLYHVSISYFFVTTGLYLHYFSRPFF